MIDTVDIGIAVNQETLRNPFFTKSLVQNFSSIYPENALKLKFIRPSLKEYAFEQMDEIIEFANSHHLKVRGHTLMWFDSIPQQLSNYSEDEAWKIVEDYLHTVCDRYGSEFMVVDVVNEAISEDAKLRNCILKRTLGMDWIFRVFRIVRKLLPDIPLFYCDFRVKNIPKWNLISRLIEDLIAEKLVDGIAIQIQGNTIPFPVFNIIEERIKQFRNMGLIVHTPEIVVWTSIDRITHIPPGFTKEMDLKLVHKHYENIVSTCVKSGSSLIGFWHPFALYSWYYGKESTAECWLFDKEFQPSQAWTNIKNLISIMEKQ